MAYIVDPATPLVTPFVREAGARPCVPDLAQTEVCRSERRSTDLGGVAVLYDHLQMNIVASAAYLAGLPDGSRCLGYVACPDMVLRPQDGLPQRAECRAQVFEVPRRQGGVVYAVPLPSEICPVLFVSQHLEALVRRLLATCTIEEIAQRTLASERTLEIIVEATRPAAGDAVRRDAVRPGLITLHSLEGTGTNGRRERLLHVIASDPARERHWSLALIDTAVGAEWLAAILAETLYELPHPEAIHAVVGEVGGDHEALLEEAFEMIWATRPDVRPLVVVDPAALQKAFRDALRDLRIACHKQLRYDASGRRQEALSAAYRQQRAEIRAAASLLERTRASDFAGRPEAARRLEKAFAAAPELRSAYFLLEGLKTVFDSRSVFEGEARHALWRAALGAAGLDGFAAAAVQLERYWPEIRGLFQLRSTRRGAACPVSLAGPVAAGLTREVKALRRRFPDVTVEELEARVLARQGYGGAAAETALDPGAPGQAY